MNVRRTFRNLVILCLTVALPLTVAWQIAVASAPAHAAAKQPQPFQALATRLHALLAPAPAATGPAVTYSSAFHLSDYLAPKYSVDFQKAHSLAKPHSVLVNASNPVALQPYSATEVIHITSNSANPVAGAALRAPASTAANDPIAPNQPLTFVVRVNNIDPTVTTQATDVYLQIKDPDSKYQDTNLNGTPREHKVFTKDPFTYAQSDNQYDSGTSLTWNYLPLDTSTSALPGYIESEDLRDNPSVGKYSGGTPQNPTFSANTIPGYAQSPSQFGAPETYLFVRSSSATQFLYNGGNIPTQTFTDSNTKATYTPYDRGAVGGGTNGNFITVGRAAVGNNGFGQSTQPNPVDVDTTVGSATVHIPIPGVNPSTFTTLGQEYECQYLNAYNSTGGANNAANPAGYNGVNGNPGENGVPTDAANSDYGDPYYLAGYDDLNGVLAVRTEWLHLHRLSNDPTSDSYNLYAGTWKSPLSPSDYYLDAVVYDTPGAAGSTATANPVPAATRTRIYDNVWGFSTQYFDPNPRNTTTHLNGTNDILVVSDNALGQKFSASSLTGGFVNLRPVFYGAESYYTDIDTTLLPNALQFWIQPSGKNPSIGPLQGTSPNYTNIVPGTDQLPQQEVQGLSTNIITVKNGLGVQSYTDAGVLTDTQTHLGETILSNDGSAFIPKSQAYSLWRILSRGRVSAAVYAAYEPTFAAQPPVSDPATGFTAPAADGTTSPKVPVATRCILWVTPFTADQPINQSGSISDTSVQTDITAYVAAGGRLLVSGQEVASGLTQDGAANNGPTSFLSKVLNVTLASPGYSSDNQTLTGTAGIGHPIAGDAYFNFLGPGLFNSAYSDFFTYTPASANPYVYTAPASVNPLVLGNNYIDVLGPQSKWRTDSALTQLGPVVYSVGQSQVQGKINTITPQNGAVTELSVGSGASLVYHNDITDPLMSGFGSRVIFSSFGLEGVGTEYYQETANSVNSWYPYNNRTNLLHNAVNYLRTGAYEGRVFQGSSNNLGVPGATVYLLPFRGVALPGTRQTYSAITSDGSGVHPDGTPDVDASGNPNPVGFYHMDGLEPGNYIAVAYKQGYSRTTSPTDFTDGLNYTTAGDTTVTNINLNIVPLPPGTVSGHVSLSTGGAAVGAIVTFTPVGGGTAQTVTTDSSGNYTISLPTGNYTVVATLANPSASSPTPGPTVSVTTATATTGVNLVLAVNPGVITGTVALTGVSSTTTAVATVAFTASGASSPAATTSVTLHGTTPGTYTSPSLAAGTYTVTASATGYVATNSVTAASVAGQTTTAPTTITLRVAATVTLSGTVTDSSSGAGIPSATITVKDLAGNSVTTAPSTITTGTGGTYTATLLEGTYSITASAVSYLSSAATTVTLTASSDPAVNFQLTHAPSLYTGYKAGRYNLISYPQDNNGTPIPFDDIFGTQVTTANPNGNRGPALIYSASAAAYLTEPTAPADGAHLGLGYFIFLKNAAGIYSPLLGTPPTTSTITVALQSGWNMIGVPSTSAVSVANLSVLFSNSATPIPFPSAAGSSKAVLLSIYGFNPSAGTAGAYYVADPGGAGTLSPYQGYWLYAYQSGLHLIIPTTGG